MFHSDKKPIVNILAEQEGNYWIFKIQDNGIGIAPKYRDRIFEIFQRLNKRDEYSGTGIGLALCKKIVESYRGKIWVESELKKGSCFYFTIPQL